MMKRFALGLVAVGATAALVTAGSFALFTANTSNVGNTFTAGTVSIGGAASTLVNIDNMAPGDSGTANGSFVVTYSGSLDAWLGITPTKVGAIFAGTTPLVVSVSDGTSSYTVDGTTQVVGTAAVAGGASKTFTVNYALPLAADNSYQGATGSVSLSVKAVQAKNNTTGNGPTSWN